MSTWYRTELMATTGNGAFARTAAGCGSTSFGANARVRSQHEMVVKAIPAKRRLMGPRGGSG